MDLEGFARAIAELNKDLKKQGIEPVKLSVSIEETSSIVPSGGAKITLLSGYIDRDGNFVETYRIGQKRKQRGGGE